MHAIAAHQGARKARACGDTSTQHERSLGTTLAVHARRHTRVTLAVTVVERHRRPRRPTSEGTVGRECRPSAPAMRPRCASNAPQLWLPAGRVDGRAAAVPRLRAPWPPRSKPHPRARPRRPSDDATLLWRAQPKAEALWTAIRGLTAAWRRSGAPLHGRPRKASGYCEKCSKPSENAIVHS